MLSAPPSAGPARDRQTEVCTESWTDDPTTGDPTKSEVGTQEVYFPCKSEPNHSLLQAIAPTAGEFKLRVLLEALQSDGTDMEVARAYGVHPVALSGWKKLRGNGSKALGASDELKEKKEKNSSWASGIGAPN